MSLTTRNEGLLIPHHKQPSATLIFLHKTHPVARKNPAIMRDDYSVSCNLARMPDSALARSAIKPFKFALVKSVA